MAPSLPFPSDGQNPFRTCWDGRNPIVESTCQLVQDVVHPQRGGNKLPSLLWMDEILHHLRHPGLPDRMPTNVVVSTRVAFGGAKRNEADFVHP